jgi:polysaccharide pyruvyl transferase WcaK-like protein
VVANRLHALILGAMAGATMVPLADRRKALAFVRDVGLDHYAPDAGAVTEALVARAQADAPAIAGRLRAFAADAAGRVESPFGVSPETP